jgi:hypothetical protein
VIESVSESPLLRELRERYGSQSRALTAHRLECLVRAALEGGLARGHTPSALARWAAQVLIAIDAEAAIYGKSPPEPSSELPSAAPQPREDS